MWELQVKFCLGQNEDCSPGDSISESSEKLLQRGGKVSTDVILAKGEYMQSRTHFFAEGFCSSRAGYCSSRGADVTKKDF